MESSKFHTNQSGEVIREGRLHTNKEEKNPFFELAHLYDGLQTQSVYPHFSKKPPDIFYWWNIDHVEKILNKMEKLAADNNVAEIVHPASGEKIILKDFFEKAHRSIAYSKDINERAAKEPPPPELSVEERRRIREKFLAREEEENKEVH